MINNLPIVTMPGTKRLEPDNPNCYCRIESDTNQLCYICANCIVTTKIHMVCRDNIIGVPSSIIGVSKCECGASSCNSPKHSDYCPLYEP